MLALRYKIVIYKRESFLIAGTASTLFLEISNLALEIKEVGLEDKSVSYIPTPINPQKDHLSISSFNWKQFQND